MRQFSAKIYVFMAINVQMVAISCNNICVSSRFDTKMPHVFCETVLCAIRLLTNPRKALSIFANG